LQNWLKTPPGQTLLAWENAQFEAMVADIFGYHALQLGLPDLQALHANRMPHRWVAVSEVDDIAKNEIKLKSVNNIAINNIAKKSNNTPATEENISKIKVLHADIVTDFEALPFPENSLDLLVLPHSLELSPDPHATLREAERVLVPEGRLIVCCFNPLSLWGFKQKRSHLYKKFNLGELYLPEAGEFISHWRLRDWLKLLNFELESSQFGCFRPAVRSQTMLQRFAWMDKLGSNYWPILGAVYVVSAVKRVHGMRLISPIRTLSKIPNTAPVSVAGKAINTPATSKNSH
jgi:SAM-dependent methyltransferase